MRPVIYIIAHISGTSWKSSGVCPELDLWKCSWINMILKIHCDNIYGNEQWLFYDDNSKTISNMVKITFEYNAKIYSLSEMNTQEQILNNLWLSMLCRVVQSNFNCTYNHLKCPCIACPLKRHVVCTHLQNVFQAVIAINFHVCDF